MIKDCLRGWEGGDGDEDFGVSVVSCADLGVGGGSGVVGGEVALGCVKGVVGDGKKGNPGEAVVLKAEGEERVDEGRRDVLWEGTRNPAFREKKSSGGKAVAVACGRWWC